MRKWLIWIGALLFLGIASYLVFKYFDGNKYIEKKNKMYVSSENHSIEVKTNDENKTKKELIRGLEVQAFEKVFKDEKEKEFYRVIIKEKEYLIPKDNLVTKKEEIIKEKQRFVKTPVTIYKDSENPDISSFAKKGTELSISGYDRINDDGSVNMYKVKLDDKEGFVYSKYLSNSLDEANKVYNEDGVYDIHKDRKYSFDLLGGSPANLDYYPFEKPSFKNNELKGETKTYYLAGSKYILQEVDKYIALAKEYGADAFVIDIKDGALAYKSEVSKQYSQKSYDTAMNDVEFYKSAVKKIQDAGFYTIGRIVLFNDSVFAEDNPADCIEGPAGVSKWVSGFSRRAWEYNVKLALESIDLFNFNEIQYDYVRFPEASFNWSKNNYNFKNTYSEEKAEGIQNFLFYATDQIHKKEKYISIDVFGESSSEYVTAYGQYWPAISNIVDVISAMPYTDHFDRNNSAYWTQPYNTMLNWGKTATQRQKEIKTPAKVRTWITAYDTPYWNVTTVYGAKEIEDQVRGLVDAGLGHGFITWNARSNYQKYQQIGPAFSKEY